MNAKVTPAYGMRPVGGWGIRGWRVFCPACGFLGRLYENIRSCQSSARTHLCDRSKK